MADRQEIRLRCLEMTKPVGVSLPDMAKWLGNAETLEAWILAGQPEPAPQKGTLSLPLQDKSRTTNGDHPRGPRK